MTLEGLDKLKAKLTKIPPAVKTQLLKDTNQNADDLVALSQRLAPKKTGDLAASIHKESGDTDISAKVVVGEPYGRFVEFGTAAGRYGDTATFVDKQTLGKGKQPQKRTRKVKRNHPGTPAQPFFYPSIRALKKTMKGRLTRGVTKVLKSL